MQLQHTGNTNTGAPPRCAVAVTQREAYTHTGVAIHSHTIRVAAASAHHSEPYALEIVLNLNAPSSSRRDRQGVAKMQAEGIIEMADTGRNCSTGHRSI